MAGVSGQHVGRLRRVYQQFSELHREFEGLYWSHFQAALDWEDAGEWLVQAANNDWSVAQMQRTLGRIGRAADRPQAR